MMRKLFYLFLFFFLFIHEQGYAQKEIYQGVFIYQFSKYINWPETYGGDKFVIGVVGDEDAMYSLETMANSKKETQGRSIEVKRITDPSQISNLHIVFIQSSYSHMFDKVKASVANKPILIVTEQEGLGQKGAMINFVDKEGKLRFELNKSATESHGLKVSGKLVNLAIVI